MHNKKGGSGVRMANLNLLSGNPVNFADHPLKKQSLWCREVEDCQG
jgi:hypothetical protein